jgi:hypothetical protein
MQNKRRVHLQQFDMHNSLAKSKSNLHQESLDKQNYVCALPPLEKLTSGILLYSLFLFHPPT